MRLTTLVLLVFAALATVTCAPPDCSLYSRGEVLPDESNERAYFICRGIRAVQRYCHRGFVFNADVRGCMPPQIVELNNNMDDDDSDEYVPRATADEPCGCHDETPTTCTTTTCKTTTCTTTTCTTPTTTCTTPTTTCTTPTKTGTTPTTTCTTPTTTCTTPSTTCTTPTTTCTTPTTTCTTPTTTCTTPTTTCTTPTSPSKTTPCPTTPCKTTPCPTTPCKTTPCPTTPCKTTPCPTTPCKTTPCPTTPCKTTPCTTTPSEETPVRHYNRYDRTIRLRTSSRDCANLPDGTILVHPRLCSPYYVCLSGTEVRLRCPGTLRFDREQGICRPRREVTNCRLTIF